MRNIKKRKRVVDRRVDTTLPIAAFQGCSIFGPTTRLRFGLVLYRPAHLTHQSLGHHHEHVLEIRFLDAKIRYFNALIN